MNRLITAKDVAKRDGMVSVGAWIRAAAGRQVQLKRIKVAWDGRTVHGEPVQAFVDFGRLLAQCPVCGRHEYVDPDEPIFYCTTCGNDGSAAARPVQFPEDWQRVEAALLAREIVPGFGRNDIERAYNSKPTGLPREWRPGTTADQLELENNPPPPAEEQPIEEAPTDEGEEETPPQEEDDQLKKGGE